MDKERVDRFIQAGQKKEAIEWLEQQLKAGSDEQISFVLGELYYAEGRTIDALNAFNTVLRINPKNTKTETYVAMINSVLNYYNKDLLNP